MVKSAIQHIRANFSDRYLEMVLTGGEPALNPDFLEILRILKEDGGVHYLGTMTNGMRPLEFFVEAMNWLDIMIISYQLENPQREKVLEVIEGLHRQLNHKFGENKRWIHVQVMVVPGELDHVRQVADRLRKLDIPVTLRRVRPLLHRSSLGTSPQFVKPYENPLIDGHQDPDLIFDEDVPVDYYSAEELQILEDWDREWGAWPTSTRLNPSTRSVKVQTSALSDVRKTLMIF